MQAAPVIGATDAKEKRGNLKAFKPGARAKRSNQEFGLNRLGPPAGQLITGRCFRTG